MKIYLFILVGFFIHAIVKVLTCPLCCGGFRLYFAEIAIGLTDPKKYYVQIDTGSDILWVNCAGCKGCPKSSELGVRFTALFLHFLTLLVLQLYL